MALSPREYQELIVLSRQTELQYGLDAFTDTQIRDIRKTMQATTREITRELENRIATSRLTEWSADRAGALLNEAERLTLGMQTRLGQDISQTASSAGLSALREHNSINSFSGMVGGFNNVALSSAQFASFFKDAPLHGHTLNNWVNRAFTREIQTKIRKEINTGVFRGKGYPDLVRRVKRAMSDLTNREAVTLTRSYVQAANVKAMTAVYDANRDIVEKVKWSATLENGFRSTGRGTCLICAGLDGRVYPLDDHPECPIHPRCRCNLLPVTKSFRELGLNIDEVKEVHRPYTIRQNKNIDAGGRRKIREVGFHKGNYGDWYSQQTDRTRINIVGPKRKVMLDRGEITFADLVNPRTGRVYRLQELDANVMIRPKVGAPGTQVDLDPWGFRAGTKSSVFAEELLYNPLSGAEIKALNWNSYGHTFPPIRAKLAKKGVLFKDGKGRWYTIRPEDIDDHANLGLKGLLKKKGVGPGPSPLPPPDPPVVIDYEAIKKKIRKTVNFKTGSKSEQLLDGLMDHPMSGKEIKEFLDSNHDFPAVRKKLVDMGVIAKNPEGRWFVIELAEEGASPKVVAPKVKPKPKATPKKTLKSNTPQYWDEQINKLDDSIEAAVEKLPQINYVADKEKFKIHAHSYKFANGVNDTGWAAPKLNASERKAMRKLLKLHDKKLELQHQKYLTMNPDQRREARLQVIRHLTRESEVPMSGSVMTMTEQGLDHVPYKLLVDMDRADLKITWKTHEVRGGDSHYTRAYFNPNEKKVQLFKGNESFDVVAHETGHAIDSFQAGKGREFSQRMGHWEKNSYVSKDEQMKYKQWYDTPKTGGKGTYSNGDGSYWYGNWVNDYEGRVYGFGNRFGEQFWAMNNQRFSQSVRYYKENLHRVKTKGGDISKEAKRELDAKLDTVRIKFARREAQYADGHMSWSQFDTWEKHFENEVRKLKEGAGVSYGGSFESKEELWKRAKKYKWGESQERYPGFSNWFENDYMKRQGVSLETNFDG